MAPWAWSLVMNEIIQQRLDATGTANALEEEQALREIIQEVALYALWRADFYAVAAFQGGTSLHGLPRFSEDLDFILREPGSDFTWPPYLERLLDVLAEYGIEAEALPRGRLDKAVQTAVITDRSVVNQLNLSFYRGHPGRKLRVKLEIDVDPPAGSDWAYSYLDFPTDFEVCHQDLPSNFALKIHTLLCRDFVKGRDWYDFNWYVKQGVSPNRLLLSNALAQAGPWAGQDLAIALPWLKAVLQEKNAGIDWGRVAEDVAPFVRAAEQESLKLWSERFFNDRIARLAID
jgi:hypothetical protein